MDTPRPMVLLHAHAHAARPRLRRDVQLLAGPDATTSLVCVGDDGAPLAVQDFEVSLLRMLDGRRRPPEVVEAAGAIGIPLSPDSLSRFLARLRDHGLLEPDGAFEDQATPAEGGAWPARVEWGEEQRQLYRRAIRLFREDHLDDAEVLLRELLARWPDTPEAMVQLERVCQAIEAGPSASRFRDAYSAAESTWFAHGAAISVAAADTASGAPDDELLDDEFAVPASRWSRPRVLAMLGLGLACVVLLASLARHAARLPLAIGATAALATDAASAPPPGTSPAVAAPAPPPSGASAESATTRPALASDAKAPTLTATARPGADLSRSTIAQGPRHGRVTSSHQTHGKRSAKKGKHQRSLHAAH